MNAKIVSKKAQADAKSETHHQSPQANAIVDKFNGAYNAYVESINANLTEFQGRTGEIQENYLQTVQNANSGGEYLSHLVNAENESMRLHIDLREVSAKRNRATYEKYVNDIKEAWSGVNAAKMDSQTLAYIGQSIWMVGCHAENIYK